MNLTPRTFENYVGIPWRDGGRTREGLDCWGLFRLVYAEVLGIDLPSYSAEYSSAIDKIVIRRLVEGHKDDWVKVDEPKPGDGAMLIIMNRPHIGVVIGDGYLLHIERNSGALIESYRSLKMVNLLEGFYRYEP